MKAFAMGVAAMLAITVIAAVSLRFVPMSSTDVFQERANVRL
jgi:hypothetical protein